MIAELKEVLDEIENGIHQIENAILEEGPFSVKKVEEKLRNTTLLIQLGDKSLSLKEKKNYYNEIYNDIISENIVPFKQFLTELQRKMIHNRISFLLEKCKKCEEEIQRSRDWNL